MSEPDQIVRHITRGLPVRPKRRRRQTRPGQSRRAPPPAAPRTASRRDAGCWKAGDMMMTPSTFDRAMKLITSSTDASYPRAWDAPRAREPDGQPRARYRLNGSRTSALRSLWIRPIRYDRPVLKAASAGAGAEAEMRNRILHLRAYSHSRVASDSGLMKQSGSKRRHTRRHRKSSCPRKGAPNYSPCLNSYCRRNADTTAIPCPRS